MYLDVDISSPGSFHGVSDNPNDSPSEVSVAKRDESEKRDFKTEKNNGERTAMMQANLMCILFALIVCVYVCGCVCV